MECSDDPKLNKAVSLLSSPPFVSADRAEPSSSPLLPIRRLASRLRSTTHHTSHTMPVRFPLS